MKFTDQLKGAEKHDYEYDKALDRFENIIKKLHDKDDPKDNIKKWIEARGISLKEWRYFVEVMYSSSAEPKAIISGAMQVGYVLAEEAKMENPQSSHSDE